MPGLSSGDGTSPTKKISRVRSPGPVPFLGLLLTWQSAGIYQDEPAFEVGAETAGDAARRPSKSF